MPDTRIPRMAGAWPRATRGTLEQMSYRTVRASHRTVRALKFGVVTIQCTKEEKIN